MIVNFLVWNQKWILHCFRNSRPPSSTTHGTASRMHACNSLPFGIGFLTMILRMGKTSDSPRCACHSVYIPKYVIYRQGFHAFSFRILKRSIRNFYYRKEALGLIELRTIILDNFQSFDKWEYRDDLKLLSLEARNFIQLHKELLEHSWTLLPSTMLPSLEHLCLWEVWAHIIYQYD